MAGGRATQGLTRSYVHGAGDVPLIGQTIGAHFDDAVARWGDREALVVRHQQIRWTYTELKRRVDDFAAGLVALGLAPGDRIGLWATNRVEWVVTQFAAAKAGLVLVSINPAYRVAEVEHALTRTGCKALVTIDRFKTSDYPAMLRALAPEIDRSAPGALAAARLPALSILISIGPGAAPGFFGFDAVAAMGGAEHRARLAELRERLQFDDPVGIQFTSGTTGSPKGATLTHHNLLNNALAHARVMGVRPGDRICKPSPIHHVMGLSSNVFAASCGVALVFPAESFDPRATLEAVAAERCTHLTGVPTMFAMMLNLPGFSRYDLSSLRGGVMGGSPCPIEMMRRVIEDMHMSELINTYGMTETSPTSMATRWDDPVERRVGSIGRVLPHLEVKIVDAAGRVVPPGTPGELCVRGYAVMLGYWNDPEATAQAVDAAGWMHTGDVATLDAGGYANIVGRLKEMVIRGGENLFPLEIETFLRRHPLVADVQVFGVPDEKFGEELCAWIKLKDGARSTADEIRGFCHGQIAYYKIPRHVRFVEEFPVNVMGKVEKGLMRKRMAEELGSTESATA